MQARAFFTPVGDLWSYVLLTSWGHEHASDTVMPTLLTHLLQAFMPAKIGSSRFLWLLRPLIAVLPDLILFSPVAELFQSIKSRFDSRHAPGPLPHTQQNQVHMPSW